MIVFIVTFCLFSIEALLHYNYGKEDNKFHLPNKETMLQIFVTVSIFSLLNSYILHYLSKHYKIHGNF
jgi:hypothetical protein